MKPGLMVDCKSYIDQCVDEGCSIEKLEKIKDAILHIQKCGQADKSGNLRHINRIIAEKKEIQRNVIFLADRTKKEERL